MDLELFKKQLIDKNKLNIELEQIEIDIKQNVESKRLEINNNLQKMLLDLFPKETFNIKKFSLEWWPSARYNGRDYTIECSFDVGPYLAKMYKERFGKLINRRCKLEMRISLIYNILQQCYSINFLGYSNEGFINDSVLLQANQELMWDIGDLFRENHISLFDEIKVKMEKLKYMLDNYEAYYIANKLAES